MKTAQRLIGVLLILGLVFRCINLDHKVYWHDEVYTTFRAAGHFEAVDQLFDGKVKSVEDLRQFQRLSPDRSWTDTWRSLADHPEHPPLYYALVRVWMQLFGSSVAAVRSLSVAFSLCAIPAFYWLCRQLFNRVAVPGIAIALISVSPFQVLYAQEARQYSLWTLLILLSSGLLLRALRKGTWQNWGLYALFLALGFYTFLFNAFVAIAHGLYVLITGTRRQWLAFAAAGCTSVIAFLPWIWVIVTGLDRVKEVTAWTQNTETLAYLSTLWGLHFSAAFIDFNTSHPVNYLVIAVTFMVLIWAIYQMFRQGSTKGAWFCVLLILIPALSLILPDLLLGGKRSSSSRYFVPCMLGAQLSVAYLLTSLMLGVRSWQRKAGLVLLTLVLSGSVLSSVKIAQADTWWNKVVGSTNREVAAEINQYPKPLVISERIGNYGTNLGELLSIGYFLEPHVKLVLVEQPAVPEIPSGFETLLLFRPPDYLKAALEETYGLSFQPRSKLHVAPSPVAPDD